MFDTWYLWNTLPGELGKTGFIKDQLSKSGFKPQALSIKHQLSSIKFQASGLKY
jgi:hypothetical protein